MNKTIIVVESSMSCFEQVCLNNYEIVYYTQKLASKTINEDGLGIIPIPRGVVLAVADGVGGSDKSYRAVGFALNELAHFFTDYDYSDNSKFVDDVHAKLHKINTKILDLPNTPQTTLTMAIIQSKKLTIFQVGDSGTLLSGQKGKIKFLTPFQSIVGDLLTHKKISERSALTHPQLNIVNNVLGHRDFYVAHFLSKDIIKTNSSHKVSKYDTLLLASDGIFDNYISKELSNIIRAGSLLEVAQSLCSSIEQNINIINKQTLLKQDDVSFILCRRANKNSDNI